MSDSLAVRPANLVRLERRSDASRLRYRWQLWISYVVVAARENPDVVKRRMTLARLKPWIHGPRPSWIERQITRLS